MADDMKRSLLRDIDDRFAFNLLSRLLSVDPSERPSSIAEVIQHPFFTGKQAARMKGEDFEYDVFLSSRVWCDASFAEGLYCLRVKAGLNVYYDKIELESGMPWEEGFCNGLLKSNIFVPVVSRAVLGDPEKKKPGLNDLQRSSPCDNVRLEHR